jgi:capsule biosynthesis phosphatase
MKRIVLDLDHTICIPLNQTDQTADRSMIYTDALPNIDFIARMREYKDQGFELVIYTSRNMRTFAGNLDEIRKHTLPTIIDWLERHNVPYDEVVIGKYWCGTDGFYVDDRAVRPSEFVQKSFSEITEMLEHERRLIG